MMTASTRAFAAAKHRGAVRAADGRLHLQLRVGPGGDRGSGLRQFGIWALTGALAQYVALLDLGAGASLSRFIAKHHHD
jgi:hypothetical protein